MSGLVLQGVTKRYGNAAVVDGVSFQVRRGAFCVIVGPSGGGKSSLLRLIAGLEPLDAGEITVEEHPLSALDPGRRNIGFVFQGLALYPHMTVRQTLGYGLRLAGTDRREIARRVSETAVRLGLGDLLERRPSQLSGGQQQRLAIGRAIIREPQLILLDEPTSGLDGPLRVDMRRELRALHARTGATFVMVTHDQGEALSLADQVVVMRGGRVEQNGAPEEIYERPANAFVARFVGQPPMNLIPAEAHEDGSVALPSGRVIEGAKPPLSGPVWVGVRAEHLTPGEGPFSLQAASTEYAGAAWIVHGAIEGSPAAFLCPNGVQVRPGETVQLSATRLTILPRD